MSMTTIRPARTDANGTSTIGGSPSPNTRERAVSDNSDSTYVSITGTTWPGGTVFGFDLPSVPSGAVFAAAISRAKAGSDTGKVATMGAVLGWDDSGGYAGVSVGSPATVNLAGAFGDGDPNRALALWFAPTSHTLASAIRVYEVYLDVYYIIKPSVTIHSPVDGDTLTNTNRPMLNYTGTFDVDGPGIASANVEIMVVNDANYAGGGPVEDMTPTWRATRQENPTIDFTSGYVRVGAVLPNDTYRAYIRMSDPVSGYSDWEYTEFDVDVSPPQAPGLVLSDDAANGRIVATVTPDNSPVTTDGVALYRRSAAGDWELVLEHAGSGVATLHDYFSQSGVEVEYYAVGWNDTDEDDRLYSPATYEEVTPTSGWWFKHPTNPALNFALDDRPRRVREINEIAAGPVQASYQPLGRDDMVYLLISDGPDTGTITFMVPNMLEWETFRALAASRTPVYLAGRASDDWRDRWVVLGERQGSRVIDKKYDSPFDLSVSWTEVVSPV